MIDGLPDLDDIRRRLRAVSDEADALDALTDADLLWLLANGWKPPEVEAPARPRPPASSFVMTTAQYEEYKRTVQDAVAIRGVLDLEEAYGGEHKDQRVKELRAALRAKSEELKALSESWVVS